MAERQDLRVELRPTAEHDSCIPRMSASGRKHTFAKDGLALIAKLDAMPTLASSSACAG